MAPNSDDGSIGSNSPSPPPLSKTESNSALKKRGSGDGGVVKVTKRRAARACVSCRARKVRCDVVEGAPCGNCRWDNVEVRATQCWIGGGGISLLLRDPGEAAMTGRGFTEPAQ